MKAVGLIVEYNPFHNGHAFHFEMAKKVTGANTVIAVMSGNFLQRGEPALVSKWARTEMALKAGVDLVYELPFKYASQHAEVFANGAVALLTSAGSDFLCFGSESGDIEHFTNTLNLIRESDHHYQSRIKEHIQNGVSYPKALSLAFQDLSPSKNHIDLSRPNNILGYHYIKAIDDQSSAMTPFTITRKSAGYHDEHFSSDTIASATSIRNSLFSSDTELDKIKQYVPITTFEILKNYKQNYGGFHSWESYWPYLRYRILHSTPEELHDIYEMEEGLEHRIHATALSSASFSQFMNSLKTKRYTWTRLQRICVHILLNTKKSDMKDIGLPTYLRLLGMSSNGRDYLSMKKKQIDLDHISKLSAYAKPDIDFDIKAARIYSFGAKINQELLLQQEYSQPPILV